MSNLLKSLYGVSLAAGVLLIAGGCTMPTKEPVNGPSVTRLHVSATSWGYVIERWSLTRDGEGHHTEKQKLNETLPEESTFAVPARDFDAILEILKPLQDHLGREIECELMMTDQVSYDISWNHNGASSTLNLYFGCDTPLLQQFGDRLSEAHDRVLQLETRAK